MASKVSFFFLLVPSPLAGYLATLLSFAPFLTLRFDSIILRHFYSLFS